MNLLHDRVFAQTRPLTSLCAPTPEAVCRQPGRSRGSSLVSTCSGGFALLELGTGSTVAGGAVVIG